MNIFDLITDKSEDQSRLGKIYGVVIGVVTNNQDPEALGRVKVKYPWLADEDESYWARMATLMAGPERGSFFLPEVDDEVLVAFEHGDMRFPYIIGMLWNGVDKPPYTNDDGKNDIRSIKSRSGHEVLFNDNDSEGKVEILTAAGHQIVLDDKSGSEKISIVDKSGSNKVEIDTAQNAITVESTARITVKSAEVNLEASGMMNIKAGGNLTIQGALVKIN